MMSRREGRAHSRQKPHGGEARHVMRKDEEARLRLGGGS